MNWFLDQILKAMDRLVGWLDPLWAAVGLRPAFLLSDLLIYLLLVGTLVWGISAFRREYWRVAARQVLSDRMAMFCFGILCIYGAIGFLDTLHFRSRETPAASAAPAGAQGGDAKAARPQGEKAKVRWGSIRSVLDSLCKDLIERGEKTYSQPFAIHQYTKETITTPDGGQSRGYRRLKAAGATLSGPEQVQGDVLRRLGKGVGVGVLIGLPLLLLSLLASRWLPHPEAPYHQEGQGMAPWKRRGLWVGGFLLLTAAGFCALAYLSEGYHLFGTDKVGQDIFYISLKSVRTGLVIGTITTFIVTPFAILFGILAGYLGGRVDDVIQYIYTTLSSIPGILLIAAGMLILQVGVQTEETIISADKRLVYLMVIMGITSWSGLCRLIRAEVLKLREAEYIQAADAFGVGRMTVMLRHLAPNVMHLVLISVVLRFSGLVLAEAVLAYIGIGVDPSMQSWGNMINAARLELAREPVVWWNLAAAFVFMLGLVLPANLFGDAVRDSLDPRLRTQ